MTNPKPWPTPIERPQDLCSSYLQTQRNRLFSTPALALSAGLLGVLLSSSSAQAGTVDSALVADSYRFGSATQGAGPAVNVGDINADGEADYAFPAPLADPNGSVDAGSIYLLFGPIDGLGKNVSIVDQADVVLNGTEAGSQLGRGQAIAGGSDLNNDGISDLVVAAPYALSKYGRVYIVYGRGTGWESVSLSRADVTISASSVNNLGEGGVVLPGDLDGDGNNDLLISGHTYSAGALAQQVGQVYGFYGTGTWATRSLSSANFYLRGETRGDLLGACVSSLGDVNGDNRPDYGVSAAGRDTAATDAGAIYVLSGGKKLTGQQAPGSNALAQLQGDASGDALGAVMTGGDVDGDGFSDLLVASPLNDRSGTSSGQVYLVKGRSSGWPVASTKIGAAAILSFIGASAEDRLGAGMGALQDVTGDDVVDFVLSLPGADTGKTDGGALAVFQGPTGRWSMQTSVGKASMRLTGQTAGDGFGWLYPRSTSTPLTGLPFLIGMAPGNDETATDAGKAYLLRIPELIDADQDGYAIVQGDCDDDNPNLNPGKTELCNGLDDNCNGTTDEGLYATWYPDLDDDGYGTGTALTTCTPPAGYSNAPGDCDDFDPTVYPGALELCDGLDTDCDTQIPAQEEDNDGDGARGCESSDGPADCDDQDPQTWPGAPEQCDGADNNCDNAIPASEEDKDQDGVRSCPENGVAPDCDDLNPNRSPLLQEVCDGVDNDCSGSVPANEADADGDGARGCATTIPADCDDQDPSRSPTLPEVCDGKDNNCDLFTPTEELDTDLDGFRSCGTSSDTRDCLEGNASVYPGALEACDGLDTNCDGSVGADEADFDEDGFRGCATETLPADCNDSNVDVYPGALEQCDGTDTDCDGVTPSTELDEDSDSVSECQGDCDDTDPSRSPLTLETCDGVDNNCDQVIPDEELDYDSDGYAQCSLNGLPVDCVEGNFDVYPGAAEICDGLDSDCDGNVSGEDDQDMDGARLCSSPADCDDQDPGRYPGAQELCDSLDQDCDPSTGGTEDVDQDGYPACQDCVDTDASVNPSAPSDPLDQVDNDCDGLLDEDAPTPTPTPEPTPTATPEGPTPTLFPGETPTPEGPTPTLFPGETPTPEGPTPTLRPGETPVGPTPTLPPGATPTETQAPTQGTSPTPTQPGGEDPAGGCSCVLPGNSSSSEPSPLTLALALLVPLFFRRRPRR